MAVEKIYCGVPHTVVVKSADGMVQEKMKGVDSFVEIEKSKWAEMKEESGVKELLERGFIRTGEKVAPKATTPKKDEE